MNQNNAATHQTNTSDGECKHQGSIIHTFRSNFLLCLGSIFFSSLSLLDFFSPELFVLSFLNIFRPLSSFPFWMLATVREVGRAFFTLSESKVSLRASKVVYTFVIFLFTRSSGSNSISLFFGGKICSHSCYRNDINFCAFHTLSHPTIRENRNLDGLIHGPQPHKHKGKVGAVALHLSLLSLVIKTGGSLVCLTSS